MHDDDDDYDNGVVDDDDDVLVPLSFKHDDNMPLLRHHTDGATGFVLTGSVLTEPWRTTTGRCRWYIDKYQTRSAPPPFGDLYRAVHTRVQNS